MPSRHCLVERIAVGNLKGFFLKLLCRGISWPVCAVIYQGYARKVLGYQISFCFLMFEELEEDIKFQP